jgi:fibronectin-binding autotransporter adhesin
MKPSIANRLLTASFVFSPLHAADVTWNGSADGSWGNAANWTGGLPASNTPVFAAVGAGNLNTSLSAAVTVTGLKFNNDAPGGATINVTSTNRLTIGSGNTISVTAGNHFIIGPATGSGSTNQEVALLGSSIWNIATGATLTNQARTTRSGGTSDFTKSGGGLLIVDNDNGNTSGSNNHFRITEGTLRFTTTVGIGLSANALTVSSGATLEMLNGASSQRGVVTLNGNGVGGAGAYLLSSGTGLTHTNTTDAGGKTVLASDSAIGVAAGATLSTSRPLEQSGGDRSLTKVGLGNFSINTAASYTGATNINAGTLSIGAAGTILSPSVSIASGATFNVSAFSPFTLPTNFSIGGSGSVNGTVADGTGTKIRPGGVGEAGDLTFNNDLDLTGTGSFDFDFESTTIGDKVIVAGDLNPAGVTPIHIASKPAGGFITSSSYNLFEVGGTLNGTASNFALINNSRTLLSLGVSGNNLVMSVDNAVAPQSLIWAGGSGGNAWDINATANWNAGAEKFYDDDDVNFTDVGVANSPVNLSAAVMPASVSVNSTGNYEISGIGKISGASGLAKSGNGILTLSTVNDYSGNTVINGGILTLGTSGAIPSGTGKGNLTLSAGTLDLNGFNQTLNNPSGAGTIENTFAATVALTLDCSVPSDFPGVIQNNGDPLSVTKTGAAALNLSGASTYSGGTTVGGSGVLNINSASAIGTGSLLISGGSIGNTSGAAVTLANGNAISNNTIRDIVFEGNNDLTTSGLLTYNSTRRSVVTNGSAKLTVGGIAGSAAAILVKSGPGTFEVTGPANTNVNGIEVRNGMMIMSGAANTYAGTSNIGVNATGTRIGTLRAIASGALGTSTVNIGPGGNDATATLELSGGITLGNPISLPARTSPETGIRNLSGTNTLGNTITLSSGGSWWVLESAAGTLTLAGATALTVANTGTRTAVLKGSGNIDVTGVIQDGVAGAILRLQKEGSGTATLSAANTYTGDTTVVDGALVITQDNVLADASTVTLASNSSLNLTHSGTDQVGALIINNNNQPAGVYTFGTGKLRVGNPPAGYADWATTHAPSGNPNDDFDGDGVSNAVEYVLGGTKDTQDMNKLPTLATSGGNLVLTFVRDQLSIDGSTSLQIQVGTNLVDWTPGSTYNVPDAAATANPGVSVTKDSPVSGKDTVVLNISQAPDLRKFARLKVTTTP